MVKKAHARHTDKKAETPAPADIPVPNRSWRFVIGGFGFAIGGFGLALAVGLAQQQQQEMPFSSAPEPPQQEPPANLIKQDVFKTAIYALKRDIAEQQGVEFNGVTPGEDQGSYAIGRLEAQMPVEMAGSISFAQCDTLVLINGLSQKLAEWSGLRAQDTIVSISSGSQEGGEHGPGYYSHSVREANLEDTGQVYTKAVEHATANGLKDITLEINRLVALHAKPVAE